MKSSAPVLQNVMVFEYGVFKEVIRLNEVIRMALILCDWCPYKENIRTPDRNRQGNHAGHLNTKERPQEKLTPLTPNLGFLA